MNYYEHHLGDYLRDTAHLTLAEDAVYRRLLDQYYIRERPLPLDLEECCKLARARKDRAAVEYVLGSFFERQADGWHQLRADAEIARYIAKRDKARGSANARWGAQRKQSEGNADAMRTHSVGNALQTPVTSKKKDMGGEPPEWLLIRSEFPKRKGDHRWPKALTHAYARLREGHTWDELTAGVRRYAAFVRTEGNEGTPYVKQAATFFGTDKSFLEPWSSVASPSFPKAFGEAI